MASKTRLYNFINGERRKPSEDRYFEKTNPATGKIDTEVPRSELMDVVSALQSANRAAPEWNKTSAGDRTDLLEKLASRIDASAFELAELDEIDSGVPLSVSQASSLPDAASTLRIHAKLLREESKLEPSKAPLGYGYSNRLFGPVSALFLPWSEPSYQFTRKLAAALACGGPIIVKPSRLASRSTLRIAELCIEAGIPAGVVNILCGGREELGEALLEHPGIPLISFTGSTESGKKVYLKAAEGFKKVQLSLGGRNPVLVFSDVDIELTAMAVADVIYNFHRNTAERGSRLFVQESIYQPFLDALKTASLRLTSGPLPDESARLRFLAASSQAGSEKGKALVENNQQTNLSLSDGYYVSPQAFVDLTLCSTLQQEEVPGPFASVASFKYQHDAIKHANNCPLANSAYVFIKDETKAAKIALKLEASRIYVNSSSRRAVDAEIYGMKASGLSGDGPKALQDFYSRRAFIHTALELKPDQV